MPIDSQNIQKQFTVISQNPPNSPFEGQNWIKRVDNQTEIYNYFGGTWELQRARGPNIPDYAVEGAIWRDTSTGNLKQYNGSKWVSVGISFNQVIPIGGIIPFHKDADAGLEVPDAYVECKGQTINDSESPLNGQTAPDLNNGNRFLRGNTGTGATGGAEQVTISQSEMPNHNHNPRVYHGADNQYNHYRYSGQNRTDEMAWTSQDMQSDNKGSDSAHENRPPYFDVVYIMRVK